MPAIPTLRPITKRLLPASASPKLHPGFPDNINNYLPLQLRDPNPSPRGGGGHSSGGHSSSSHSSSSSSSSRSKSKGSSSNNSNNSGSSSTTVVVVGGGPRYYGPHNNLLLPVWAIILIVVLVFETILFCCALGWFTKQAKADRKALYPSKPRPPLRYSRIWLNAFIVASWLWIPIGLFNMIMELVVDQRKGIKKERKVFRPLVDGLNSSHKLDTTLETAMPYKGAGVGAGAGQDPELANVKRTNSAYAKIPSSTEVGVEEVKSKYDTPEDVKVPFETKDEKKEEKKGEKKNEEQEAAPAYPGDAFAGYAPAPVAASPIVHANEPAQQGAAASYFAMSNQPQSQPEQQQGAAASYFAMGQSQSQNLPSTNPWGRQ